MGLDERRARHAALMLAVSKNDVRSWYQSFLGHLERVRATEDPSRWRSPEPIRAALEKLEGAMGPQPPSQGPQRDRGSLMVGDHASKYSALALKTRQ
jgi:hypothetical protein